MSKINQFIHDLNQAWLEQRYDDLRRCFYDQVVMLLPGSTEVIAGAAPMVESYRQFAAVGRVLSLEIISIDTFPFGNVVMCHMAFAIEYEMGGDHFTEKGLEVYAVDDSGPQPLIVWRTQLPLTETAGP